MDIEKLKEKHMTPKTKRDPYKAHRKNIWFTEEQLKQLEEIQKLTGFDIATTVRASMDHFLSDLKK